jgi:hypothetical protein
MTHKQRRAGKLFLKVRKSPIRKFLGTPAIANQQIFRCASPQIAYPHIFMINPQIRKFQQNTEQHDFLLCTN